MPVIAPTIEQGREGWRKRYRKLLPGWHPVEQGIALFLNGSMSGADEAIYMINMRFRAAIEAARRAAMAPGRFLLTRATTLA